VATIKIYLWLGGEGQNKHLSIASSDKAWVRGALVGDPGTCDTFNGLLMAAVVSLL